MQNSQNIAERVQKLRAGKYNFWHLNLIIKTER